MASQDPKVSTQGTAGKGNISLRSPQKLVIIMCESGKSQREVMASYSNGLSTINDTKKQWD